MNRGACSLRSLKHDKTIIGGATRPPYKFNKE